MCAHKYARPVEYIQLRSQYRLYAPHDTEIQRRLLELGKLPFDEYVVLKCGHCGLEYSDPLRAPASEWYEYAYNTLDFHASDRWEFDFVVNRLRSTDRIGEVGCGTGVFLRKCADRGLDAHGVDFSRTSVQECLAEGLSVSVVRVAKDLDIPSSISGDKRNVIVSFHVLEHLEDPHRLFGIAGQWGTRDAALYVAVPSNTRLTRTLGKKDFLDDPPHHLTRWTPESFAQIGARNGWTLTFVLKEPLKLRQRLWALSTNDAGYLCTMSRLGVPGRWTERALRYLHYPAVALHRHDALRELSGFSMLARFVRQPGSRS